MKKKYKHILSIVVAMILVIAIGPNTFADRILRIPDVPNQPYVLKILKSPSIMLKGPCSRK